MLGTVGALGVAGTIGYTAYKYQQKTKKQKDNDLTQKIQKNDNILSTKHEDIHYKIIVFTDFDGTITGIPGNNLINSEEYKNLFNRGESKSYDKYEGLKKEPDLSNNLGLLINKTPQANISEQATKFLKAAIQNNIDIVIVSKNREDYIRLLLKKNNIDDSKININCQKPKNEVVNTYIENNNLNASNSAVIVLDDYLYDFNKMNDSVNNKNLIVIYAENKTPEEYPNVWSDLLGKIEEYKKDKIKKTTKQSSKTTIIKKQFTKDIFSQNIQKYLIDFNKKYNEKGITYHLIHKTNVSSINKNCKNDITYKIENKGVLNENYDIQLINELNNLFSIDEWIYTIGKNNQEIPKWYIRNKNNKKEIVFDFVCSENYYINVA